MPPIKNPKAAPKVPALLIHAPVSNTQLQPIIAPNASATVSKRDKTRLNRGV